MEEKLDHYNVHLAQVTPCSLAPPRFDSPPHRCTHMQQPASSILSDCLRAALARSISCKPAPACSHLHRDPCPPPCRSHTPPQYMYVYRCAQTNSYPFPASESSDHFLFTMSTLVDTVKHMYVESLLLIVGGSPRSQRDCRQV